MFRSHVALPALLLSLLLTACATAPVSTDPPLVHTESYAEFRVVNHQGLQLFVRRWEPQGEPRANLVIVHGTALHGGLYRPVAEQLAAAGYRVYAYDMQGWGRSDGKGVPGYVKGFYDYADDLMLVMHNVRQNHPGVPNYVMGESLGGAVALYTALKDQTLCDGIITSAIGYKPNVKLLGLRAPGFINAGVMTLGEWTGELAPRLPLLESDAGIRMVLEDDATQAALLEDPHVAHGWLPAVYVSTLVDASDFIDAHLPEFDRPILLLHGTRDMLVPVESSREVYDRVASEQKSLRLYDSAHTVLLEPAASQSVADVVQFLDGITPPRVAVAR